MGRRKSGMRLKFSPLPWGDFAVHISVPRAVPLLYSIGYLLTCRQVIGVLPRRYHHSPDTNWPNEEVIQFGSNFGFWITLIQFLDHFDPIFFLSFSTKKSGKNYKNPKISESFDTVLTVSSEILGFSWFFPRFFVKNYQIKIGSKWSKNWIKVIQNPKLVPNWITSWLSNLVLVNGDIPVAAPRSWWINYWNFL